MNNELFNHTYTEYDYSNAFNQRRTIDFSKSYKEYLLNEACLHAS